MYFSLELARAPLVLRSSALTVIPFNQASKRDVEALVDYIYANLSIDLDYITGIPEDGREIYGL